MMGNIQEKIIVSAILKVVIFKFPPVVHENIDMLIYITTVSRTRWAFAADVSRPWGSLYPGRIDGRLPDRLSSYCYCL